MAFQDDLKSALISNITQSMDPTNASVKNFLDVTISKSKEDLKHTKLDTAKAIRKERDEARAAENPDSDYVQYLTDLLNS